MLRDGGICYLEFYLTDSSLNSSETLCWLWFQLELLLKECPLIMKSWVLRVLPNVSAFKHRCLAFPVYICVASGAAEAGIPFSCFHSPASGLCFWAVVYIFSLVRVYSLVCTWLVEFIQWILSASLVFFFTLHLPPHMKEYRVILILMKKSSSEGISAKNIVHCLTKPSNDTCLLLRCCFQWHFCQYSPPLAE